MYTAMYSLYINYNNERAVKDACCATHIRTYLPQCVCFMGVLTSYMYEHAYV